MEPVGDHVLGGHGWIVVGLLQKLLAGQGGHWVFKVRPVLREYDPNGQGTTTPTPQ
jgi:hypothetical protein